ncbi:MAG: PAS domain S-box protein [Bacteroidetes bacterium]|nr:PAS domain S-box protein [Bacteroidota bacterium]
MNYKPLLSKKSHIIAFIAVLGLLIIIGGYLYYLNEERVIRQQKYNDLKVIADLKEDQLVQWHNERVGDAKVITRSYFFIDGVEQWIKNKNNNILLKYINERLSTLQKGIGYESIFLSTNKGELLLAVGSDLPHFNNVTSLKIIEGVKNNQISFTDFYYNELEKKVHYDIIAPLVNDKQESIAAIVFRIDPSSFLFPFLQTWPTPSTSSETAILRVEKDSVLFLNELRHRKNTALKLKISLTQTDDPAVQSAWGRVGIFEGIDYRGVEVLSDIRVIPFTNWIMVSKVDKSEIYADVYTQAFTIAGFCFLLVIVISVGFIGFYNNRQRTIFEELYNKEKEIIQHQERFKVTMDSLGEGVITVSLDGKVQYMNISAEELTGWNLKEARGKSHHEIYPVKNEETGQRENNILDKVLKHGIVKELANHTILITKSGKEIAVTDTGAPIYDVDGSINGIVIAFQDETEKRQQRKLLIESEAKYRNLTESLDEVIYRADPETFSTTYVNSAIERFYGYTVEEWLRDPTLWESTIHPDDKERVFAEFTEAKRKMESGSIEYRIIKKDKTVRWVEDHTSWEKDQQGNAVSTNGVMYDITERKQAEEQTKQLQEYLQLQIERMPIGLIVWDTEFRVRSWNPATENIFGFTAQEALGKHPYDVIVPKEAQPYVDDIWHRLLEGDTTAHSINDNITKDGRTILCQWSNTPLKEADGTVRGVLSMVQDITDRKRAEEAMRRKDEHHRAVVENIFKFVPEGLLVFTKNLSLMKQNKAFDDIVQKYAPMLEYTEEELAQKIIEQLRSKIESGDSKEIHIWKKDQLETDPFRRYELILQFNKARMFLAEEEEEEEEEEARIVVSLLDITERKRAEAALRESEWRYRNLVDNALVGVYSTTLAGEILFVNDYLWKMFEFGSPEELKKENVVMRYKDPKVRESLLKRFKEDGAVENFEFDVVTKRGNVKTVLLSATLAGDIMSGMMRDITERKRAEKVQSITYRISQSAVYTQSLDELYKSIHGILGELIPVENFYIALYDRASDLLTFPYFVDLYDEPAPPMKPGRGLTAYILRTGRSLLASPEVFSQLVRQGDVELVGTDCVDWLGVPLKIERQVIGVMVTQSYTEGVRFNQEEKNMFEFVSIQVAQAIERKRAEEALRESEVRFRSLYENATIGIYRTTPDGEILMANRAFLKMLGYNSLDELKFDTKRVYAEPDTRKKFQEIIDKENIIYNFESTCKKANGEIIYITENARAVRDEKNNIVFYDGVIEDITYKKKVEEALIQAKEKAEEANRLKDGFISAMSHEIRTPLNVIIGYNGLISDLFNVGDNEEVNNYFGAIYNSSERLITTITQIMDISRIEACEFEIEIKPLPFIQTIKNNYNQMDILAQSKNIPIKLILPEEEIFVLADHYCLNGVLTNLLNNAIKFSKKGTIELKVWKEGDFAYCSIKDEGIGISVRYQKHLFETFSQEEVGTSRTFEGTGLGLALTKRYLDRCNGTIKIESKKGKGTKVIFNVPLA